MLIYLPFARNSSSVISKRIYSFHPRLFSLFISSKYLSKSVTSSVYAFSQLQNSSPRNLQTQKTQIPVMPFAMPLQHRHLIIHAGDDSEPDEDEEEEERKKKEAAAAAAAAKPKDASQIKPFYDPFNKKPAIEEPEDPTNLPEIFHKMKEDNFVQQAAKMFDALSQDGYMAEAMSLFGVMKDNSKMPDVVSHTAIIEAYCKAGRIKEGLKSYMRMQASGVRPNSYTYTVLIQGLCQAKMLEDAGKYTLEMLSNGWNPNAAVYVTVVDSYLRAKKENELQQLLVKLKDKGFVADDKEARKHMKKMGRFNRGVMDALFGQYK
ncbi:hypothetical protein SUGI_0344430 [Cryptomeria japonica]|uniref:pentatricopeptide repeat-containing protein At4g38150 n=1 Tax=Cryptomeria japonica TaxID=3369 RepID=UPI002408A2BB|nr:pentatricopeptide repeat-containing protein At4g38150 [Cryptomeria japonica]GLJ19177.1 hypothetical protein SUGI_0344430 [Cryptomeria japonica]